MWLTCVLITFTECTKPLICIPYMAILGWWRRRRDSNPRDPSGPTPLAGERLRPLGHVSAQRSTILSNSKTSGKYKKTTLFTICSFLRPQLTRSASTFAVNFIRNSTQTTRPYIRNKSNGLTHGAKKQPVGK